MNELIMQAAGFGQHVADVKAGKCPFCKAVINTADFKDEISVREYRISGLCQKCQDATFDGGNEDPQL